MSFIVPTYQIVEEYIQSRDISRELLAEKSGLSVDDVNSFFSGEEHLSLNIIIALNELMPDIEQQYWINYDRRYKEMS